MLLPSKAVTEKQVAANKGNAKKSTGPRTERGKQVSSQNGFKHGLYAQMQFDVMDALREDPAERRRTIDDLIKGYQPEPGGQQMVVEEIATLHWRRGQLERSQNAQMGERVHNLETKRERLHLQINSDVADVSQAEVLEKGLRNIKDCPAKFEMLLDKFNALIQQVEDCNYSDAVPYLTAIYAKEASLRGATIFNRFLGLMRLEQERAEALQHRRPWPPPGDPVFDDEDAPTAEDEPGYDPRLDRPSELLLHDLTQELHDVTKLYGMYIRDEVILTQMKRDAALAPEQPGGYYLAREIWLVDRDIDAKTRLFMKMRVDDRNWRLAQQEDEDRESEEGETAKPAGKVGSRGARPEADRGPDDTPDVVGEEEAASGAGPEADPEPDGTADAPGEPTVTGPAHASGSSDRNEADDSASNPEPATVGSAGDLSDPERRVEGPEEGSAVKIPALLMLVFALDVMVGVRTRSAARTPPLQVEESTVGTGPQLQPYVRGPRVRALEYGSAATALIPVPAFRPKGALRATGSRAATAMASTLVLRPKGGSSAGALQGGQCPRVDRLQSALRIPSLPVDAVGAQESDESAVRTPPLQPPTGDDFFRTEAVGLLKTKDDALGPNPIRTHFEKGEKGGHVGEIVGQEDARSDGEGVPEVAAVLGP